MVEVRFEVGNACFEGDTEGTVRMDAVAQMLNKVANAIAIHRRGVLRANAKVSGDIRDGNGNHIGTWAVSL